MEADNRDLLTVEQVANYLQLSQSSIRSYIRQGKLKAFRVAGKRKVLIPRDELLKLLEPARGAPLPRASPKSRRARAARPLQEHGAGRSLVAGQPHRSGAGAVGGLQVRGAPRCRELLRLRAGRLFPLDLLPD